MNYKHTFVICSYGDSEFLEECMCSIKEQTVLSEVILYTSTPSDYINSLASKHQIPVFTARGGGIGKDWNNALSYVKTPYATIAHQDDIYLSNYTEKVLSSIKKSQDSIIIFTDYKELQNSQEREENLNLKIKTLMLSVMSWFPNNRFWRNRVLAFGNPICCPAVTYNLSKIKGFKFSEEFKTSLDWFAWYQLSQNYSGQFTYIKEKLMYHRIHDGSETTATIEDKTRTREDLMIYELLWPKWFARKLIKWYEKSQESNH